LKEFVDQVHNKICLSIIRTITCQLFPNSGWLFINLIIYFLLPTNVRILLNTYTNEIYPNSRLTYTYSGDPNTYWTSLVFKWSLLPRTGHLITGLFKNWTNLSGLRMVQHFVNIQLRDHSTTGHKSTIH
jgi:hypothetical protein